MSPSGRQCQRNATAARGRRRSGRAGHRGGWCPGSLEAVITIGEYGEFALIAAIAKRLPASPGLVLGIGDDAAVLRAPDGQVVATTDMLIEGRHFRREWSAARDIGAKAAARNLADIAAMGARPTALLVSFAGPGDLAVDWVLELADGIAEECAAAGAGVAGGDTSSADSVLVAITALGDLGGAAPVTRSGARPGDVIAVAGPLGRAAAGLALLSGGLGGVAGGLGGAVGGAAGEGLAAEGLAGEGLAGEGLAGEGLAGEGLAGLVRAHRRPAPPYQAGPEAAALGATAMIDISDGLLADLGHVAQASGVEIRLAWDQIAAGPAAGAGPLIHAADLLAGADWRSWVLTGGDDHALVAAFPSAAVLPGRWQVIGEVAAAEPGRAGTVTVDSQDWPGPGGWQHFTS